MFNVLFTSPKTMSGLHKTTSAASLNLSAFGKRDSVKLIVWSLLFIFLGLSWSGADMRPGELFANDGELFELIAGFFAPDFHRWELYAEELLVTVQMALWGSVLAAFLSIPCGLLCCKTLMPTAVHLPMRWMMEAAAAVHEIVFAMLFVVVVGLGPFAGVLALCMHTAAYLAKLLSDLLEDEECEDGERHSESGILMCLKRMSRLLPLWIAIIIGRFQINIRSATVLGMVGAGGIGVSLWEAIRGYQYAETSAILIMIMLMLWMSGWLLKRLRHLLQLGV